MKKTLSIFLPIRKNSKRIKNKNILPLKKFKLGLSEIKILQLLRLKKKLEKKNISTEIIISTDIKKVQNFIKNEKNLTLHLRGKKLSTDNSLQKLINLAPKICKNNYILWTHVTSPLYREDDYMRFIEIFFKRKANSAFSCTIIQKFLMNDEKKWISHNYKKLKWPKTQDLKKLYEVNSAAFIAKKNVYINNNDRLDNNPLPIVSKKNSSLDIDDKDDFDLFKRICGF